MGLGCAVLVWCLAAGKASIVHTYKQIKRCREDCNKPAVAVVASDIPTHSPGSGVVLGSVGQGGIARKAHQVAGCAVSHHGSSSLDSDAGCGSVSGHAGARTNDDSCSKRAFPHLAQEEAEQALQETLQKVSRCV